MRHRGIVGGGVRLGHGIEAWWEWARIGYGLEVYSGRRGKTRVQPRGI